jgi:LmbE family N-acetylglucosaminyl deacetylase
MEVYVTSRRVLLWAGVVVFAACIRPMPTADRVDVLVIAPHPDDEVLLAGGVLDRAVQAGQRVAVILVTNGDFTCERDGYLREAESVAGLRLLGVPQDQLYFLGYPDGALSKLSPVPLAPQEHRDPLGRCIARDGTYADRSAGHLDVHTRLRGSPAEWTSTALTFDLVALLKELRPREVFLPHAIDDHPDHSMTYIYFRRALDLVEEAPRTVHRGIVHAGPCWPSDCVTYFTPEQTMPPLPPPLARYFPDEILPADAQRKLDAIARYNSQAGTQPRQDWLSSFARREETFYSEQFSRIGPRWIQTGATPRSETEWVRTVGDCEEWNIWGPEGFTAARVTPRAQ